MPDAEALYATFAAVLRQAYGRLPVAGVPRILRPRRKQGTTAGFTLVDVGGNWLRRYRAVDTETDGGDRSSGLARVVEVAARQGDARGDNDAATTATVSDDTADLADERAHVEELLANRV